eukprot:jgi/Chrzof1/6804/Cz19g10110.t1
MLCFEAARRSVSPLIDPGQTATTIHPVVQAEAAQYVSSQSTVVQQWSAVTKFKGKSGEVLLVPDHQGGVQHVVVGLSSLSDVWGYAALPGKLPPGAYALADDSDGNAPQLVNKAVLGWMLGCYKFERYKSTDKASDADQDNAQTPSDGIAAAAKPMLVWPDGADRSSLTALAHAVYWCRDMITTPAEDMGPQHLEAEAAALVAHHEGAVLHTITGDDLLKENYPAVHTVGRASARPPVFIDISWQPSGAAAGDSSSLPLIALVGKGVCFDSGGLDIKTAAGMKLMKKDMGGAALMLSLAHVMMSHRLPVRLRVLVPAVENAISGNAYRPLDVLRTRAGISVENGNTDAEGRLILSDALYEAASDRPDLLIDAATLTGAARAALGPELPAVFSTAEDVWTGLLSASEKECDPLWRMPLYAGYRKMLDSKVADISSTGAELGQAGAVVAALFLKEFTQDVPRWVHIDTGGYVSGSSVGPGKPEGGEALGLRALWSFIKTRYAGGST